MAIEIVDLPIKNGGSFHSYDVSLLEGTMVISPLEIAMLFPCFPLAFFRDFNSPGAGAGAVL